MKKFDPNSPSYLPSRDGGNRTKKNVVVVRRQNKIENCNPKSETHNEPKYSRDFQKKNKSSKKVLANHLLQFDFKREDRAKPKHNNNIRRKNFVQFDKKRYVEANFSFVLSNVDKIILNKEGYVDWNNVEKVILYSYEKIKCPICLEKPLLPKIARCGHIFCVSCILRYFSQFDLKKGKNDLIKL